MLKEFPSDKTNGTRNAPFFSRVPAPNSFTFNQRFLYEPNHNVHLSKSVGGIFHFRFRFVFVKVFALVQQKSMNSLTLKHYNSFQN